MSDAITYGPSTIWRYELPITDEGTEVTMPTTSRALHAAIDQRTPPSHVSIWVLHPTGRDGKPLPGQPRKFLVCGTGHPIPGKLEYLASVIDQNRVGQFVWHVFSRSPKAEWSHEGVVSDLADEERQS